MTLAGTCKAGRTRSLWVERQNGLPCLKNPSGYVALEGTLEAEAATSAVDSSTSQEGPKVQR